MDATWNYIQSFFVKSPSKKVEREQLILTPLDEFSTEFILIRSWEEGVDPNISKVSTSIKNQIKNIQKQIEAKSKIPPVQLSVPQSPKSKQQIISSVYINIYNKKSKNLYKKQIIALEQALKLSQQMDTFVQNIINKSYPISIDFSGFSKKIHTIIESQDLLVKEKHLIAIKSHCKYPNSSTCISLSQFTASIASAEQYYDSPSGFVFSSEFDDIFNDYISFHYPERVSSIIQKISNFQYSEASTDILQLHKDILNITKIPDDESNVSYLILYYTINRFIFDIAAIQNPYLLGNDLLTEQMKNATLIREEKVCKISSDPKLFVPSFYNLTVQEIFDKPQLSPAVDYLRQIQFHNNPLDIAYLGAQAINILIKEILRVDYVRHQNKGDESKPVPPEALSENRGMIPFDDIFTYFFMALSIDPPANMCAITQFLKSFDKIKTNSQLEYASLSIQSAVQHICNFKNVN